jgi:hypothetical protein
MEKEKINREKIHVYPTTLVNDNGEGKNQQRK